MADITSFLHTMHIRICHMTTIGSIAANNGFFLDTPSSAGIAEEQGKPRQGTDTSRQTYSPGQPVKAADRATDTLSH